MKKPTLNFSLRDVNSKRPQYIYIYVRYMGGRKIINTGIKVCPVNWDKAKHRVKNSRAFNNAEVINIRLAEIERMFSEIIDGLEFSQKRYNLTRIKYDLENILKGQHKLVEALKEFIPSYIVESSNRKKKGTIQVYQSTLNRIQEYDEFYNTETNWESIDLTFYAMRSSIFYIFIILCISSCDSSDNNDRPIEKDAQYYYETAQKQQSKGEFGKALRSINEAIHMDSLNNDYHALRGEIFGMMSDTIHTEQEYEYIISMDSNDHQKADHINKLIKWEKHYGKNEKVTELLLEELELFKDDPDKHMDLVKYVINEFRRLGDMDHAISIAKQTIIDYPDYSYSHKFLAELAYHNEKWSSAIKHYENYLEIDPMDYEILNTVGVLYEKIRNISKAKSYFKMSADLGYSIACEHYRELTAETRYRTYSKCCDGSRSNSTGRGTCSHHGGVCRVIHEPYKYYTHQCN